MTRLLTAASGLALIAALALPAGAASTSNAPAHPTTTAHKTLASAKAPSCPKGDTWVKSYKTKDGKIVKGYCRAPKSTKSTGK